MRTVFETEGDIRGTDLLAGLVQLWREGSSGSLRFSRPGATAAFHLAAGELVGVSASESRFETASILLRAGKLDAATLERLVTPEGGDRAVFALQAGILTKREWRWGEKIRAVEVLSDLLTWIEGDYVFDSEEQTAVGEFRLTVPRLVLELFLRSRDRALVLHYLGGADVPLVRAPHFDAEFAIFGLTADAEAVVRLIDGKATAAEIAREGPADAFSVEKLLAALVTLGLVHPAFAADEPVAIREATPEESQEDEEAEEQEPRESAASEVAWQGHERAAEDVEADAVEKDAEDREDEEAEVPEPPREIRAHEAGQALEPEWGSSGHGPSIDAHALRGGSGAITDAPLDASRSRPDDVSDELEPERSRREEMVDLDARDRGSEPVFEKPLDMATGIGADDRRKPRVAAPFLWLLAILAAGVAMVILMRGRGSAPETLKLAPVATPTALEVAAIAAPAPTIAVSPAPSAAPVAAAPAPTRARPTPPPAAAAPTKAANRPAPAGAAATPGREAGGGSRQAWLDRAARDHQRARGDRKALFTIQLELACEVASLADAWKHDRPAGTMWVLSTPFQGRTCFRVLWGRYPTREAAHQAIASVPPFFSTPRNHPIVTAIH
jgi:hypothetical protein